jgi:ribosomal 50S subunit-associated protein YjgA (DUF615 family)
MPRPTSELPSDAEEDLTSRTDLRRSNRAVEEALASLSHALFELAPRRLTALDLPPDVYDALLEAHALKNARARRRQLGLVRVALRSSDWAAIAERVRSLVEGRAPARGVNREGPAGTAQAWLGRLLGEGFAGLDAFLAEYPSADRTRLLDLIYQVDRSTQAQREKAVVKLTDTLARILASGRR